MAVLTDDSTVVEMADLRAGRLVDGMVVSMVVALVEKWVVVRAAAKVVKKVVSLAVLSDGSLVVEKVDSRVVLRAA